MTKKILSIIIPVYNEEATVVALLDKVWQAKVSLKKEIIIVNDGSTDSSEAIIKEWQETRTFGEDETVIIINKENGGKGSAVRTGIERSTGDVVIIQDADLEYDPNDYQSCVDPILEGKTRVVYGSRGQIRSHSSLAFYLGGLAVTNWVNLLFGSNLADEPTCYKTFDGNLIRTISFEGKGFEWEPEITAKLLRLGYEIFEVPVKYFPRKPEEGKKINWKDGLNAFWTAFLWRFLPLNKEKRRLLGLSEEKKKVISQDRERKFLYFLIFFSFFIRLLIALPGLLSNETERFFFRPDSGGYVQPALALLETGRYNESPSSEKPATARAPGFPIFLSGLFAASKDLRFPVILFCLISALVSLPIFYAGKLFGGLACGGIAAVLYSLNITSIAIAPLYLSDTLCLFFSAACFAFFTRFYFKERLWDLWFSVGFAGISTLIRPTGILWIFPCLFLVLIFIRKTLTKRLIGMAGCILIFFSLLFPWMLRNEQVGAGFRLDTNIKMVYHHCAALLSVVTGESTEVIRKRYEEEISQEFSAYPEKYPDENSRIQYIVSKAKGVIHKYPWTFIKFYLFQPYTLLPDVATFFELLGFTKEGGGTLDILTRYGPIIALKHYFGDKIWLLFFILPLLFIVFVTYLGCAIQLCLWVIQKNWFLFFFFLTFVYYYLVLPGPITMPRYQLPALPLMTIMAAGSFIKIWRWKR